MKQNKIPYKERIRNYDYQYNQTDRQIEICEKKHMKEAKKWKEGKADA